MRRRTAGSFRLSRPPALPPVASPVSLATLRMVPALVTSRPLSLSPRWTFPAIPFPPRHQLPKAPRLGILLSHPSIESAPQWSGTMSARLHHARRPGQTAPSRPLRKYRPGVELLEDRLTPSGAPFVEPPVIASNPVTHVLTATLTEAVTPATVGDRSVINTWTYNGSYVGPTLMANPGDLLDITLVNDLPPGQTTNLHTHGLHVSPLGNSDNILLEIEPGESNHFQIQIPADHPQGLYWYHPHHHGTVNEQISLGLSGLLVIGRPDGGAPQLNGYPQRLLALKNALLSGNQINVAVEGSDPQFQTFTVNGQLAPVLTVPIGQWQIFNLANIGNNAFYTLQINTNPTATGPAVPSTTAIPVLTLAEDGNPFSQVEAPPSGGFFAYPDFYRGGVRVDSLHEATSLPPFGSNRDAVVTTRATGDGTTPDVFSRAIPLP